jgi:type IV secretory pathway VirB10-like protein
MYNEDFLNEVDGSVVAFANENGTDNFEEHGLTKENKYIAIFRKEIADNGINDFKLFYIGYINSSVIGNYFDDVKLIVSAFEIVWKEYIYEKN